MAEAILVKTQDGSYRPMDEQTAELLKRHKVGGYYKAKFTEMRNPGFHRKFFALLNIGFDAWEPEEKLYKGQKAEKCFNRFRKDCTILAGYYCSTYDINGDLKLEAESIAFGSMEQDEFEKLYSSVANVILRKILTKYTRDDLNNVVDQVLGFV